MWCSSSACIFLQLLSLITRQFLVCGIPEGAFMSWRFMVCKMKICEGVKCGVGEGGGGADALWEMGQTVFLFRGLCFLVGETGGWS